MLLLLQLYWKPTPLFTNKLKGFHHFIAIPSVSGHYPSLSHRYMSESLHTTENGKINLQIEWKPRNMSGISPQGQAAGDAQQRSLLCPCFPLCPLCQLFSAVCKQGYFMKNGSYLFQSALALHLSPHETMGMMACFPPQSHGTQENWFSTEHNLFLQCMLQSPWRGRKPLFSVKRNLKKKASVLQPQNFVLYNQEQQKFPITSWI